MLNIQQSFGLPVGNSLFAAMFADHCVSLCTMLRLHVCCCHHLCFGLCLLAPPYLPASAFFGHAQSFAQMCFMLAEEKVKSLRKNFPKKHRKHHHIGDKKHQAVC